MNDWNEGVNEIEGGCRGVTGYRAAVGYLLSLAPIKTIEAP